jgi:transcriptional regulator with XRE-family HTH domain
MGKDVGNILHESRIRKNYSVTKVAESACISPQMVRYVESGVKTPSIAVMVRIACAVDITDISILMRAYITELAREALDGAEEVDNIRGPIIRWLSQIREITPTIAGDVADICALSAELAARTDSLAKGFGAGL